MSRDANATFLADQLDPDTDARSAPGFVTKGDLVTFTRDLNTLAGEAPYLETVTFPVRLLDAHPDEVADWVDVRRQELSTERLVDRIIASEDAAAARYRAVPVDLDMENVEHLDSFDSRPGRVIDLRAPAGSRPLFEGTNADCEKFVRRRAVADGLNGG